MILMLRIINKSVLFPCVLRLTKLVLIIQFAPYVLRLVIPSSTIFSLTNRSVVAPYVLRLFIIERLEA